GMLRTDSGAALWRGPRARGCRGCAAACAQRREKLGLPVAERRSGCARQRLLRLVRDRLFARRLAGRRLDGGGSQEAQDQARRQPPHRAVLFLDRRGGEISLLLEIALGLV